MFVHARALVFLLLPLFAPSAGATPSQCEVVRAAYDVGTSGIKLSAKVVDVCAGRIVRDLFSKEKILVDFGVPVRGATLVSRKPFGEAWWKVNGIPAFVTAKRTVEAKVGAIFDPATGAAFAVDEHVGIATHAFRVSTDGQELLDATIRPLGIDIRVISQEREGENEFAGVLRALRLRDPATDPSTIASWGIGEGSQQLETTLPPSDSDVNPVPVSYLSAMAAGTFRFLLQDAFRKVGDTANPISSRVHRGERSSEFMRASALADREIESALGTNRAILDRMLAARPIVYGVGGIHTGPIRAAIGSRSKEDAIGTYYDFAALTTALRDLLDRTDLAIARKVNPPGTRIDGALLGLAKKTVVSMILVRQSMIRFGIERVYLSNADGTGEIYFMEEFARSR